MEGLDAKYFAESIPYMIARTAVYFRLKATQIFSEYNIDLTLDQFTALHTISHNKDICQRDLCKLILKDRSNTGRILNILEEKGLINRIVETKNNRLVKKIYIAPKGQQIVDENFMKLRGEFAKLIGKFPKDKLDDLKSILSEMTNTLSKETNIQI